MDPYPLFPIFAFLSFFLVLIPLPWHLQALNSGTCLFMIWTAIGCLIQFVNSIVWHNNTRDWAPLWCDISTRLTVGISVAVPAASLCINRRLYKIATCQTATITYAQKRRNVLVDLAIGLGIPAVQMALQFVVQGHRYDIWEDIGCLPTTVNTPAAYPLSFVWPNVISLISAVFCMLTLRSFMLRRAQFTQFLSSKTSISVNHYFRLMCLATTEILFTIPLSSYGIYLNVVSQPIYHWKSWSDTHFDFYQLDIYPASIWRSSRLFTAILELNRWSLVFCAFVFFGFFGFAEEARRNYQTAYRHMARRFGYPSRLQHDLLGPKKILLPLGNTSSLSPTFVHQKSSSPLTRCESFHSSASTDYTETLQASPNTLNIKFDKFDQSPETEKFRLSRATV